MQIRLRTKPEQGTHSTRVQIANGAHELIFIGNGIDLIQVRFDWLNAFLVDGGLVHAGAVKISDLLGDRIAGAIRGRGLLENVMQQ